MTTYEVALNTLRTKVRDTALALSISAENMCWPNDGSFNKPSTEITWIRTSYKDAGSSLMEIGQTKRTRHNLVLFIQIFSPIGYGEQPGLVLGDGFKLAIQNKLIPPTNLTFRTASVVVVGRSDEVAWWQTNVVCPFFFDLLTVGN
jgi:hypothetical protein